MGHQTVFRRPTVIAGVAVALVMAVTGILAPVLATHDPNSVSLGTIFVPPGGYTDGGSVHVLGNDNLGRDVLSRIVTSFRTNLYIGLLGSLLGLLAAWLLVIVRSTRGATPNPEYAAPLFGLPFHGLAIVTYIVGVLVYLSVAAAVGVALEHIVVCAAVFSAILPMTLVYESARRDAASSIPIRLAVRRGVALFPVTFSLALLMGLSIEFSLSYLLVIVSRSRCAASDFEPGRDVCRWDQLRYLLVDVGLPIGDRAVSPGVFLRHRHSGWQRSYPASQGSSTDPGWYPGRVLDTIGGLPDRSGRDNTLHPLLLSPLFRDEPAIRVSRSRSDYRGYRGPGLDSGVLTR